MGNLILKSIDKKHLGQLVKMRQHEAFAKTLVDDFEAALMVKVHYSRDADLKSQFRVNRADHDGVSIEVTPEGVSFRMHLSTGTDDDNSSSKNNADQWAVLGLSNSPTRLVANAVNTMLRFSNNVTDQHVTHAKRTVRPQILEMMQKGVKKCGLVLSDTDHFMKGYGNGVYVEMRLAPGPKLAKQIKTIVELLLAGNYRVRLDALDGAETTETKLEGVA